MDSITVNVLMLEHQIRNKKLAANKAYSIPPAMCRSKPCKFEVEVNLRS